MTDAVGSDGTHRRICVMTANSGGHVAPLMLSRTGSVPGAIPNTTGDARAPCSRQQKQPGPSDAGIPGRRLQARRLSKNGPCLMWGDAGALWAGGGLQCGRGIEFVGFHGLRHQGSTLLYSRN